ncbi:hypothetical protein NDU88_003588 [Pleurodeles waltl]|uniref:Uncharacterized protein n=1 Tax=Pleurodeles waltl TaxID=8319 RepID=A0AAV7LFQ2_PLEWA|nr:hypothetical protein NDU88_003588 [Pleurodeles waltl]
MRLWRRAGPWAEKIELELPTRGRKRSRPRGGLKASAAALLNGRGVPKLHGTPSIHRWTQEMLHWSKAEKQVLQTLRDNGVEIKGLEAPLAFFCFCTQAKLQPSWLPQAQSEAQATSGKLYKPRKPPRDLG